MEVKESKAVLLVFLTWCMIILFNPAQSICVHGSQTNPEQSSPTSSSSSATHSSNPPPSTPSPTQQSSTQTPPSTPQATPVPEDPVPPTPTAYTEPEDSPDAPAPKKELPKLKIPQSTGTLNLGIGGGGGAGGGLGVGGVGVGVKPITDPIVKGLCDKTDYPHVCLSSLAPFFTGKTDVTSVIKMLIKSATEQTKQAIMTATKMSNEVKSDPRKLSMFNNCKEVYDDALDNLQKAVDAIPAKDILTLQTRVSAAVSDYGTCDDGFTEQPNPIPDGVSPMAKVNENLKNIASVILSLAKLIP